MAHVLHLEAIGDDQVAMSRIYAAQADAAMPGFGTYFRIPSRQWVAEITGRDSKYKLARTFLPGHKSFEHSNSIGSRGVEVCYTLWPDKIYDVSAPRSWKRTDRYYCRVEGDSLVEMSEEEVFAWLDERSASTS